MVIDAMRNAEDENEIYCLLTAYIDAARFCHKRHFMPERVMHLPLRGVADVRLRFDRLMGELDRASRELDDKGCVVLREALHVFGVGLDQLQRKSGKYGDRTAGVAQAA